MVNSVLLWRGHSVLDGAPVALIATGIKAKSQNAKTGAMVQTYIIRSDINPTDAVHNGADFSICGNCQHRGNVTAWDDLPKAKQRQFAQTARKYDLPIRETYNVNRSCYVVVFQGPANCYAHLSAGKYPEYFGQAGAELLSGLNVRLGTYGDPAAVPFHIWAELLQFAGKCTGYTHQWKTCDPRFADYCMASCDTACEAIAARAMGYRTFRVGVTGDTKAKGEFLCPASSEAGKVLQCESCLACGGNRSPNRADVFIPVHGATGKIREFNERSQQSE